LEARPSRRSLSDLVAIANDLADRGVGFRCLDRGVIDTTTAAGTVVFQIFGAFAQYEREQMLERTMAGLQAARARGRAGGRPTVMTPAKRAAAQQMFDSRQHTVQAIAAALGVSRTTVYRNIDTRSPSERTDVARRAARCARSRLHRRSRSARSCSRPWTSRRGRSLA
jgi:DNA invertase Pin-like site-specific DNA recombinase